MDINIIIKTLFSVYLASLFAYLWLSQESFYLLTTLMFVDTFTGVVKSLVFKETKSRTFTIGVLSKMLLLLIPLSIAIAGKISNMTTSWFVTGMFTLLAIAELWSILANIYQIRTKKKIEEYDAVTTVIKFALDFTKSLLTKLLDRWTQNPSEEKIK